MSPKVSYLNFKELELSLMRKKKSLKGHWVLSSTVPQALL